MKILLSLTCIFILHFYSYSQCLEGNCQNGTGTYLYPSGAKYTGQFVAGQIQGLGSLYISNGDVYTGEWSHNFRQGKGKMMYANGDVYFGSFVRSKINGLGIMKYAQGGSYSGEWKDNLPDGKGKYLYANGEQYEGILVEGKRQGLGTYTYEDHSTYSGQWSENQRDGQGTLTESSGKKISGEWSHDKLLSESNQPDVHPNETSPASIASNVNKPTNIPSLKNCNDNTCDNENGVYEYNDGSKYVGPFKHGNPFGKGILYYANGDRYEGEWDDVAPNGQGIMYFTSGRVYAAIWDHGRPVKQLDSHQTIPTRSDIKPQKDHESRIWAVIVGVARYEHMPALRYSDDDAYRIYAFLKSPEGGAIPENQIKILIDEDATRNNIISAMQEQYGKADENDMVLLYYSGHGVNGSVLPIDFDGYQNNLYHDEISQLFESSQAKHKLCLIDACYSGSMTNPKADFSTSINRFYSILDAEKGGTAFILSCKPREVSLEDSGLRQGIFSHYLMNALRGEADADHNKIVTVQELYNYISSNVKSYTQNVQNPLIDGRYNPNMPVAMIR